jgi:hypothetical protein
MPGRGNKIDMSREAITAMFHDNQRAARPRSNLWGTPGTREPNTRVIVWPDDRTIEIAMAINLRRPQHPHINPPRLQVLTQ